MKIFFVTFFILFHIYTYAQQPNFVGCYQRCQPGEDTSTYIYLSRDSIKQVKYIRTRNDKKIALQIKCGTWAVTGHNAEDNSYSILFRLIDGSSHAANFYAFHFSIPMDNSTPPDGYNLTIDYADFIRFFGPGGYLHKLTENK